MDVRAADDVLVTAEDDGSAAVTVTLNRPGAPVDP